MRGVLVYQAEPVREVDHGGCEGIAEVVRLVPDPVWERVNAWKLASPQPLLQEKLLEAKLVLPRSTEYMGRRTSPCAVACLDLPVLPLRSPRQPGTQPKIWGVATGGGTRHGLSGGGWKYVGASACGTWVSCGGGTWAAGASAARAPRCGPETGIGEGGTEGGAANSRLETVGVTVWSGPAATPGRAE